jgi:predicted nucleic acid-binding protein
LIVVDASVLTDFLIGRAETIDAVEQTLKGRESEPLYAPELIEPETLNALRRLVAAGKVSDERATQAVADLGRLRLVVYPHAPLRDRVWGLRDELTAYDALYLALAEALDEPLLLTSDGGLAVRARGSLGDERVVLVA